LSASPSPATIASRSPSIACLSGSALAIPSSTAGSDSVE
jgi:hypothetical protein